MADNSDNGKTVELSRRRILGGLGVLGAAGAASGAGTYALFSDTETSSGNTVQAGTLDLEVGNTDALGIDVKDKAPGWSNTYQANVDNAGTIEGGLRVKVTNVSASSVESPESEESYAQSNGMKDEVWVKLGFGGTNVITTETSLGTAEMLGEIDALQRLSGSGSTTLDVEVGIDQDATNEVQGDKIDFDIEVSLLQKEPITVSSSGADYTSIQNAVDAASAGDTVKLLDSSYTESFTINSAGIGLYGQGATIDVGNADRGVVVNADNVTVSGLDVTNAEQAVEVNADNDGSSNSPRKTGVALRDITVENGASDRALVVDYSDNVVVNNATIINAGNDGFTFWYTNDSRAENITANKNDDNGVYFNGDNNALLHSTADQNNDEGVDINWYNNDGDWSATNNRVLVDGVTAKNNGEDDFELHDNGADDSAAANSKLLKNVESGGAPTGLRLVRVAESEVQTVNASFPNGTLDSTDNDVDP